MHCHHHLRIATLHLRDTLPPPPSDGHTASQRYVTTPTPTPTPTRRSQCISQIHEPPTHPPPPPPPPAPPTIPPTRKSECISQIRYQLHPPPPPPSHRTVTLHLTYMLPPPPPQCISEIHYHFLPLPADHSASQRYITTSSPSPLITVHLRDTLPPPPPPR